METFEDTLHKAGYPLPASLIRDGEIHRFGEKNCCWYIAGEDYGIAGDWKGEHDKVNWRADTGFVFSPETKKVLRLKIDIRKREYETEKMNANLEAAKEATRLVNSCAKNGESQYLARKVVRGYGIFYGTDEAPYIAVPLRDVASTLWSIQKIYDNGDKQFLKDGRKRGCFHVLGKLVISSDVFICEGYATGATIHEVTGKPVIICFDAGNIEPVLSALAPFYPVKDWIIAADNDAYGSSNTGKLKAEEAAKRFGCRVIMPTFSASVQDQKPTDFNDLATMEGIETVKKQISLIQEHKNLVAVTLHDFLAREIPAREMILSPIIPTQGLVMLYAMRGIGKTYVSLSVALAVASGGSVLGGRWSCDKPRRVMFVDGEMPASVLQERLASLSLGIGKELPAPDYLKIITQDMQEHGIPDLATNEGRQAIDDHLHGVELLILDNLSSLLRQGKENEAESWMPLQGWLLSLRKRGISVLIVHHANKTGGQRGTSKKEDLLDTVISLKRTENYDPQHGAQFTVIYEKARGFHGDNAKPFEARLTMDDNSLRWEVMDVEDNLQAQILAMKEQGLTQREIAKELGCSPAKVNRILKGMKK